MSEEVIEAEIENSNRQFMTLSWEEYGDSSKNTSHQEMLTNFYKLRQYSRDFENRLPALMKQSGKLINKSWQELFNSIEHPIDNEE